MNKPKTPMLDKMQSVHDGPWTRREGEQCRVVDHSQLVGEFLDWLYGQGIHLAKWGKDEFGEDAMYPTNESTVPLLARYFEIDLDIADDEKRALLQYVRDQQP